MTGNTKKALGVAMVPDKDSEYILIDGDGRLGPEVYEHIEVLTDDAMRALGLPQAIIDQQITEGDVRYNVPKQEPKVSEEDITRTIQTTSIYAKAKEVILNAQRRQVAYGLEKYPEPLNANTWSTVETIDHIIDESIDKLHYLVMLRERLLMDSEVHRPYPDMKKLMEEARKEEE